MAPSNKKSYRVKKVLNLEPRESLSLVETGDIGFSSPDGKFAFNSGVLDFFVGEITEATLTNKTMSAADNTFIFTASITNADMVDMPAHTFKGNNTAGSGPVLDLTPTELTAELDEMVGDTGGGGTKGLVPAPGAGDALKVLTGAGTYVSTATGTVTSVSYTGDGVIFSATPTAAVTTAGTLTPVLLTPAANKVLAGPASGAAAAPTFRSLVTADKPALNVVSKTANYTTLATDEAVLCNTNAFTVTVIAAASALQPLTIKKIGSDANAITIARSGSDVFLTVQGSLTSLSLATQGESVTLIPAGAGVWHVVQHNTDTPAVAFTPTGSWTSNVTYTGFYRRRGDVAVFNYKVLCTSGPTSANLALNIPFSWTIDTTKLVGSALGDPLPISAGKAIDSGIDTYPVYASYNNTTSVRVFRANTKTGLNPQPLDDASVNELAPFVFSTSDYVIVSVEVPITGWSKY